MRKTGVLTVAVGFVGIGIMLAFYFHGLVPMDSFRFVAPALIILFGLEIVWKLIGKSTERIRFSFWSVVLIGVFIAFNLTPMTISHRDFWRQSINTPVKGEVPIDSAIKQLKIQIPAGKITITGNTSQTVVYSGNLAIGTVSGLRVQKTGDTLEFTLIQQNPVLTAFSWLEWIWETPHLDLQVPQSLLTQVRTSNGSISVANMMADVNLKTSNGSGTIVNIGGSVTLVTSNGNISLTNISGTVAAKSSNGNLMINSPINGDWACSTSNGGITLTVPKQSDAVIDAVTSNGSFNGDLSWKQETKNHRISTLGSGANKMLLVTSNGSIQAHFAL